MNIDDIVARHRPEARLGHAERAQLVADLVAPDEVEADGVLTLVDDRPPDQRRPRRTRRTWLPAAAAAAAVAVAAGGLAAWRVADQRGTAASSAGDQTTVCAATLPAAWDAPRSGVSLQVDGHDAVPHATTPDGVQLLSWAPTPTTTTYGLRGPDGHTTPVATFPRGGAAVRASETDGRRVVFGLSSHGQAIDDIQLIDPTTGSRIHLLRGAPMPSGWVVTTDVAIFAGHVYWGATPSATQTQRGDVLRYSIADRTYRVMAQLDRFPTVVSDIRGVAWPSGAVRRPGLPSALNPLLDAAGDPVDRLVTDGTTYAWQLIGGDQTIFHWADQAGDTRTFRVAIDPENDGAQLTAVSGPFLFFHVNKATNTEYVLDSRTGALAPARGDEEIWSAPGRQLFAMLGGFEYRAIAPDALTGFGCD